MLDVFHLPTPNNQNFWYFTHETGNAAFDWIDFALPRGLSHFLIIAAGGGGGAGGGFTAAAGNARGGGAGGGSSGLTRIIVPRLLLPDRIYMRIGRGGPGGAAGVDGTSGGTTTVSVYPTSNTGWGILVSQGGLFGAAGAGAGSAAAGAGGTIESATSGPFHSLGPWVAVAGQAGAAGGVATGAVGASVTWGQAGVTVGGGAGGGGTPVANTDNAGGTITNILIANSDFNTYTLAGGAAAAGAGSDGLQYLYPPYVFTGGSGGGTAGAAGTAGAGGNGAPGSGGGGGGGGVTGGAGGRGGAGFVILTGW